MKERSDAKTVSGEQPKAFAFALVAIPFLITAALGMIVTGVAGLTVYANVVDVKSRDFQFVLVCLVGTAISIIAGYIAARRSMSVEIDHSSGQAVSLLRKYRRAIQAAGGDEKTGQYHIGESYLRELLGKRGA